MGAVGVNPVQTNTYVLDPGITANPITFGSGTNIDATFDRSATCTVFGNPAANWNITNQGRLTGEGIVLLSNSTVINAGSITGVNGGPYNYGTGEIELDAGGAVINEKSGIISGARYFGIYVLGGSGTVTNAGTIGSGNVGVKLQTGGTVTNQAGGTITGGYIDSCHTTSRIRPSPSPAEPAPTTTSRPSTRAARPTACSSIKPRP
jgi:hypothetical protein